jgi:probable HAF family extracellular repeat protein
MKSRFSKCLAAIMWFAMLAIPAWLAAQEQQQNKHQLRYKLVDLGTFGGPQSWVFGAFEAPAAIVNNKGTVVGGADTPNSNPNYPNINPFLGPALLFGYADPFVFQAFKRDEGTLVNLGTLPAGYNSFPFWISGNGLIAGASENGVIDPVGGYPEVRAVLWKDGQIMDLGTLSGKSESAALAGNNRAQVVGAAFDAAFNSRAFLWTEEHGLQDLGTLGACCAIAGSINEGGQIAGESGLCDTCNQDVFLWENGSMQRIPDFGGPFSFHYALNNRGQVVGQSDLPGGAYAHPFLWDKNKGLRDLGLLPSGLSGSAHWINEAGEIVGLSGIQNDQFFHAVLWKHGITDLGTVDGDLCSLAGGINSHGQIVGGTFDCNTAAFLHAFLWENPGPMVDLNTLVAPGSGLALTFATSINDRGEIAGQGVTPSGENHAFLLSPCEGDDDGCPGGRESAVLQRNPAPHVERSRASPPLPVRRMNRYHVPGPTLGAKN